MASNDTNSKQKDFDASLAILKEIYRMSRIQLFLGRMPSVF